MFRNSSTLKAELQPRHYILGMTQHKVYFPFQPFECVEATLSRDLTSQLGLTWDSGIWVNLRGASGEGVRVRESGPGQVVISGTLVELLASRVSIKQVLTHF